MYVLNLWLVSSSDICEGMELRCVRQRSNSAEPLRSQRVKAFGCCYFRRDLYVMRELIHTCVCSHSQFHFSCVGTGIVAPRVPSPARGRGLSNMLGKLYQAVRRSSRTVIETRCAVSGAVASNVLSDQAPDVAAQKIVSFLLWLCVVATTSYHWTCLLEVMGAVGSKSIAGHGGYVKPSTVVVIFVLVPCIFPVEVASIKTVRSERPNGRTPLMLLIAFQWRRVV